MKLPLAMLFVFFAVFAKAELSSVSAVAVDTQGNRYLVLGHAYIQSIPFVKVVRLTPEGQIDPSWAANGVLDLTAILARYQLTHATVAVGNNGEVVVAANRLHVDRPAPNTELVILRVAQNGTVQNNGAGEPNTVVPFTSSPGAIKSVVIDDNGKILVASMDDRGFPPRVRPRVAIARFTEDGDVDTTFNERGMRYLDLQRLFPWNMSTGVTSLRIARDGRVFICTQVVHRETEIGQILLLSVNADGTGARVVNRNTSVSFNAALGMLPQVIPSSGGRYLYVAHLSNRDRVEVRRYLTATGQRDADFGVQIMENSTHLSSIERSFLLTAEGTFMVVYQTGANLVLRELNRNGTTAREIESRNAFITSGDHEGVCRLLLGMSQAT